MFKHRIISLFLSLIYAHICISLYHCPPFLLLSVYICASNCVLKGFQVLKSYTIFKTIKHFKGLPVTVLNDLRHDSFWGECISHDLFTFLFSALSSSFFLDLSKVSWYLWTHPSSVLPEWSSLLSFTCRHLVIHKLLNMQVAQFEKCHSLAQSYSGNTNISQLRMMSFLAPFEAIGWNCTLKLYLLWYSTSLAPLSNHYGMAEGLNSIWSYLSIFNRKN